ncbi:peroxidase 4-like protein [Tanacetum coccineum]
MGKHLSYQALSSSSRTCDGLLARKRIKECHLSIDKRGSSTLVRTPHSSNTFTNPYFLTSLAQLTPDFYDLTCPKVFKVVGSVVKAAVARENRMGASLLRLHFHDCFVNGCDASILLDDTSSFRGEKTANPNVNSARGFEVIDDIKSNVERVCPGVVSCADILAITALESVLALGGPFWRVNLGRRDSKSASFDAANGNAIPPPTSSLDNLVRTFQAVGLTADDMVALAGAHTIGQARCTNFRPHVYNDTNVDPLFASLRRINCPVPNGLGDNNLAPLDARTSDHFDNSYYNNLLINQGLLHSDMQLLRVIALVVGLF